MEAGRSFCVSFPLFFDLLFPSFRPFRSARTYFVFQSYFVIDARVLSYFRRGGNIVSRFSCNGLYRPVLSSGNIGIQGFVRKYVK